MKRGSSSSSSTLDSDTLELLPIVMEGTIRKDLRHNSSNRFFAHSFLELIGQLQAEDRRLGAVNCQLQGKSSFQGTSP